MFYILRIVIGVVFFRGDNADGKETRKPYCSCRYNHCNSLRFLFHRKIRLPPKKDKKETPSSSKSDKSTEILRLNEKIQITGRHSKSPSNIISNELNRAKVLLYDRKFSEALEILEYLHKQDLSKETKIDLLLLRADAYSDGEI